jgi:uncharacterized protein (DUF1697 family)
MTENRSIVFLRAVNVGGTGKVPMADLRSLLGELGYRDVATWIQSGNIVLTPPDGLAEADLAQAVEAAIAERMGVKTRAIVRDRQELETALEAFPWPDAVPKLAHIIFLDREPAADAIAALQERDFGEDVWTIVGREMFVRYDEHIQSSKLSNAAIERVLKVSSTARNLTTVRKMIELSRS